MNDEASSQSAELNSYHRDINPGFGACLGGFVIAHQSPLPHQPAKGAFHDPAVGQYFETGEVIRTFDHLDGQFRAESLDPLGEGLAGVAPIHPQNAQPGKPAQHPAQEHLGAGAFGGAGWRHRHAEHQPDEPTSYAAPMFERGADGSLKARLALSEIHAGYALRGERPDNETAAALAAVQSVFDLPELHVELQFERGQIQYVNNRATGHARTEFVDHPEPERKRHLIRMWLRDGGKRGYRG